MERAVFVYTTYPSVVEAERAGRALVEQHLCACVNILPGMISHYWWQGTVERGEEVVMIIKTRSSLAEHVSKAVKELHSLHHARPAGDPDRERRSRLFRLADGRDSAGGEGMSFGRDSPRCGAAARFSLARADRNVLGLHAPLGLIGIGAARVCIRAPSRPEREHER